MITMLGWGGVITVLLFCLNRSPSKGQASSDGRGGDAEDREGPY